MHGIIEAAKQVGVDWWKLRYADRIGVVQAQRIVGRRVFSDDDVVKLRLYFQDRMKLKGF
ncbi:hypothetical protein AYO44_15935 [Planctomycetaceae bacterium SCGC AG-212-F19]|nr:hypothetical protein AYO44_15935 [Planctomycetaceae bacterium SCGC AG-212-F19]